MKKVIFTLALMFLANPGYSVVPIVKDIESRQQGIATKKTSHTKRFSKKQGKNALGIWGLSTGNIASDSNAIFLNIKDFEGNKKGGVILYDVLSSDGGIYDSDLVGYVSKGLITLTVPYINGHSHVAMRLNKKGDRANFVDTFIGTNICEFTESQTNDGYPIFVCIFPSAQVGSIETGEGISN